MTEKREIDNWKTNNDNYFQLNKKICFNFAQNISNKMIVKRQNTKFHLTTST